MELRPGRVIANLENGQIKADVPGLFSQEDIDSLPPIYPWTFHAGCNSFSSVLVGDEVWVMREEENPRSLHWLRKDDISKECGHLINANEDLDIICSRDAGTGRAILAYSESTGWMISLGDAQINISPELVVSLTNGGTELSLDGGQIFLGPNKSHTGCYGDVAAQAMDTLSNCIKDIMNAASKNVYTMPISTVLPPYVQQFKDYGNKISSDVVKLD